MKTSTIFQNGSSQAIRIPKEFRLEGKYVSLKKFENILIVCPKGDDWQQTLLGINTFTDDFLKERNQPTHPDIRDTL